MPQDKSTETCALSDRPVTFRAGMIGTRLLRGNQDLDRVAVAGARQLSFKSLGVHDAALWIVDKAKQRPAGRVGRVMFTISGQLIGNFFGPQARPGLDHHDHDALSLQHDIGPLRASGVPRRPFLSAETLKLQGEQGIQDIPDIVLVFDLERRSVRASLTELSGHLMKTRADFPNPAQGIRWASHGVGPAPQRSRLVLIRRPLPCNCGLSCDTSRLTTMRSSGGAVTRPQPEVLIFEGGGLFLGH